MNRLLKISIPFGIVGFCLSQYWKNRDLQIHVNEDEEFINWSGNHSVRCNFFYTPKTEKEIEKIIQCHDENQIPLRPIGTGLSPNGLGFCSEGMISLLNMNKIISIEENDKIVRVQAGITIEDLTNQLKSYGLTLQNFASIREQQVVGFTQSGAHGTGIKIPPVDEQVISFKILTPSLGTLEINRKEKPKTFSLLNVGLGCFGIITEVTIQCVQNHQLVEETYVTSKENLKKDHIKNLNEYQHVRYLWIPNSNDVVIIKSNPKTSDSKLPLKEKEKLKNDKKLNDIQIMVKENNSTIDIEEIRNMSLTDARDYLLSINPTDKKWVDKINQAEISTWKSDYSKIIIDDSDKILGFDCGGQQLVFEVAIPIGDINSKEYNFQELNFIEELLNLIKKNEIPAPSPIEQRWTARSTSLMSPAYSTNPSDSFSWVGIIMYLPYNSTNRDEIEELFKKYRNILVDNLGEKYKIKVHWAKLELPDIPTKAWKQIANSIPLKEFNELRKKFDKNKIFYYNTLTELNRLKRYREIK